MIPEAAVEAAHNAIIGGNEVSGPDIALDFLSREQVRRILEAAAPHIRAQALEDAAKEIIAPGASSVASAWLSSRASMLRPAK